MGVTAGEFKGFRSSQFGWEMAFFSIGLDAEEAKEAVTVYLMREYDARSIYFFKRKGDISTKFWARFTRGDI